MEKIPDENTFEKTGEYERVKREFVESLSEPAFLYTHSSGKKSPASPTEYIQEDSREVRVHFPENEGGSVLTLIQETGEEQEVVQSIARQITQAIQEKGVEPTAIDYSIVSYRGMINNIIEEYKDLLDEELQASIPFDEVRDAIQRAIQKEDQNKHE